MSDNPIMYFPLQNSYLWKVHSSPPIFLFGTMHIPYTHLWNVIPENVKTAFSSSEQLCLELELLDHDTRQRLNDCKKLPKGAAIEEALSEGTISRITAYLEEVKLVLPSWMGHQTGGPFFGSSPTRYYCNL